MAARVVSRVAGLGALTAAGQVLMIGSLPAYTRIFDPGTYGAYVIFVGAFAVVSVLAGLRYDSAIVLPRSDGIAFALSVLVLVIALGVSVSIAACTLLFAGPAYTNVGYGLAAATVIGSMQRILTSWCVRDGRFLLMGCSQFLFALVTVAAQLSLAPLLGQLPALIWGYVGALGTQTVCLAGVAWRARHSSWQLRNPARTVNLVARKYVQFPKYMVGYALASTVRDRLIQIVLGIGAGAGVVGRFGLAYRVVFAPNSLVYSSVSPIFYAIATRGSRATVGRFAAGMAEVAFVALVTPYVVLALEAPVLTESVLSPKWHGTGPYLQALAAPALVLATTCWIDRAFDSFRRQKVALSLEATFTLLSVSVVGLLSRVLDPVTVAWSFSALGLVYYWFYFLATFVACRFPLEDFRRACATGAVSLSLALILGGSAHRISSLPVRVAAYASVMVIVAAVWLKYRKGADILRMLVRSRLSGSQP